MDETRPLEVNTQCRHWVYKKRWEYSWWYAIDPKVQFLLCYMSDKCGVAGSIDPDSTINSFNFLQIRKEEEYLNKEYVLEQANKFRKQIRPLDNGNWLLEDHYWAQQSSKLINAKNGVDINEGAGNYIKGLVRDCRLNGIDPASLRGVEKYIPPAKEQPHTEKEYNKALKENS